MPDCLMTDRTALFTTTPEANAAFREALAKSLPQGWIAPLPPRAPSKTGKPNKQAAKAAAGI